ncbi:MAG: UbiX family flavin prenyltransferase [Acidobacteria bacterium]|nr:UbiX family flavin prenyltransferase [Acidobacteriota bacterium]NIM62665.1 UbiX family flavin prenyltransferase [Acidobacteriota bacterium]NIO59905.1 UbiX family flavin prenyltransferase [Acidobacteriota bacterium]NIQ86079.1 UbiX family flavin prenyltransferase [Acidobacteriota bacterium]NIT11595.1 UbiX family flavin prenyltransferase [Acidobacteriota bacterium]
MTTEARRFVVAVTGASGALYAVRLIKAGLEMGCEMHLVASDYGKRLLIEECGLNLKTTSIGNWLDERYPPAERPGEVIQHSIHDLGDTLASGSVSWDGMAVIPCSMKTLSGIANGFSSNLIERCADVTLKENRRLVLVPRETPLNRIHIDNMSRAANAGAHICPAMPAFYTAPKSFEDLADFIAGRVFSLLGVRHDLIEPWRG